MTQHHQKTSANDPHLNHLLEPGYDQICDWVERNLFTIYTTIVGPRTNKEGIVTDANGRGCKLRLLRQIAARQDVGARGPILGFLDLVITEHCLPDDRYGADAWAVGIIVRDSIPRLGILLKEIELCRQGLLADDRVCTGLEPCYRVQRLRLVVISRDSKYRRQIEEQRYKFIECPGDFGSGNLGPVTGPVAPQ